MSQFSTMTMTERKVQAAAICREVYGSGDVETDAGRKVSAPRDIVAEELSLCSNRGSRLFKMRQRRSEKYTFESVRSREAEAAAQMSNGRVLQPQSADDQTGPERPDSRTEPRPESVAPGHGGPLKDVPPEGFNSAALPKSYHSPWDQAVVRDPALAESLIARLPEPGPRPQLPGYKSFNRVATPFGGFGRAPRAAPRPVRAPEADPLPDYPELRGDDVAAAGRPTFNRTALGWVSAGPPRTAVIPESDDL